MNKGSCPAHRSEKSTINQWGLLLVRVGVAVVFDECGSGCGSA